MDLLQDIITYNATHCLFKKGDRLLVATSGGVDSMVLCYVLQKLNIDIAIAHCNFMLRASESDEDAQFVEKYANKHRLSFFTERFDTAIHAKKNKQSIQEAARVLRYEWMESIRKKHGYTSIATAHHLNDNIETLLMDLAKGTGIRGMRGILPKHKHVIRPMLSTSKEDIIHFANKHKITWREDTSNKRNDYDRNKIRNNIIPQFMELNPALLSVFTDHFNRFLDIEQFHQTAIDVCRKKIARKKNGNWYIPIRKLVKLSGYATLLYEWLLPLGFNASQCQQMIESFSSESGKVFLSKTHRIVKDRHVLILTDTQSDTVEYIEIKESTSTVKLPLKEIIRIHTKPIDALTRISKKPHIAYLDYDQLEFPLILRKWKHRDYFYPYGLYGKNGQRKKKKVSDFFTDKKMSLTEKEQTWILQSGQKIAWIVGHRIDDRFKQTDKTKKVYQLRFTSS